MAWSTERDDIEEQLFELTAPAVIAAFAPRVEPDPVLQPEPEPEPEPVVGSGRRWRRSRTAPGGAA